MTALNLAAEMENEQLQQLVGPSNEIFAAAAATLYTNNHLAGDPRWVYRNSGILAFIKDVDREGFFLTFYHLEDGEKEWEQKILLKLKYMRTDDREHIMETESGSARVTFNTTADGKRFGEAIIQRQENWRLQMNRSRAVMQRPPPPLSPTTKNRPQPQAPPVPPRTLSSGGLSKNPITSPLQDGDSSKTHSIGAPPLPSKVTGMNRRGSDSPVLSELDSYLQAVIGDYHKSLDSPKQGTEQRGILKIPDRLRPLWPIPQTKKPATLPLTPAGSFTVYREELWKFGTLSVILEAGDIAESKAEVIVSSTNSQFSFQSGGVAQVLSRRAGPGLQQKCKSLAPLNVKDVVRTQGYQLNCTEVFHCCCPSTFSSLAVKEIMLKCLNMASDSKYRTMVMPVFGTGNLGYPLDEVLISKVAALSEFALNQSSSLRSVTLIVYFKDTALVEKVKKFVKLRRDNWVKGADSVTTFPAGAPSDVAAGDGGFMQFPDDSAAKTRTIFRKPATPSKNPIAGGLARFGAMLAERKTGRLIKRAVPPSPPSPDAAAHSIEFGDVGKVSVILKVGDISAITADVIVNSTGNSFDLQTGGVAKALSEKAGPKLQLECMAKSPLRCGDVVKTESYSLSCKAVFHCCCPSKYSAKVLQGIMRKCFQMATDKGYSSMAMPVIGTGNLGYPTEDVLQVFMDALHEFVEQKTCSLRVLALMAHHKDHATIKKIHDFAELWKTGGPKDLPSNWVEPWDKFQSISIDEGSKEREEVEAEFRATLRSGTRVKILQVCRIQNPTTYKQYELLKKEVIGTKNTTPFMVERNLWHGTTQTAVENISREFFDRGLAGENVGTLYGKGCYFSTTTRYSHDYAKAGDDGSQYMFRVRVITGTYCLGVKDMTKPPFLPLSSIERYDSVVNNMQNPSIFVVFKDAAAYPEYVVQYRVVP